jgi:hypothetical protein
VLTFVDFPKWWPFGAFAFWRWVFIRPELAGNAALIAHERAHLDDQRGWLGLPSWLSLVSALLWVLLYFISPRFRFTAEVIGHAAQIKAGGGTIDWAAAHIVNRYWTLRKLAEASAALTNQLGATHVR